MLRFLQKGRHYYFIKKDDEIIGAVSVTDRKDNSRKRLAPIFILPQFERMGYAQKAIREVEKIHGEDGGSWTRFHRKKNCAIFMKKWGTTGQKK